MHTPHAGGPSARLPHQHASPNELSETSQSYFEQDLESFRHGAGLIINHVAILADQIPEAWHITAQTPYPPDWTLLALVASEQLGYDMPHILHPLRLTDLQAQGGGESEEDAQEFALFELVKRATTGSIYAYHLEPDWRSIAPSAEHIKKLRQAFPDFVSKGFMTSVLTRALQGKTYEATKDQELYETFANTGVKPLAHEELLGLMQRIIRYASRAFPNDYPPPPERQPRSGP